MTYEANRPVKTSIKTFEIIEQLSRTDGVRISDLAADMETSKGIIHNHLSTLRELNYVRKADDGYQLSPKLLRVGFRTRSNSRLYTFAHDFLTAFASQFETGVLLVETAGSDCIVVDAHDIPDTAVDVGTAIPSSTSLPGQVISAQNDTSDRSESVSDDTEAMGDSLVEQGYIVGPLSAEISHRCVAAPIVDETGDCYGCLAVLLPAELSDQQRQRITEATVRLRERIETRFRSGWDDTRSFATEKHSWIE
jgi:DNA-binding IclR family transcriptional regulator